METVQTALYANPAGSQCGFAAMARILPDFRAGRPEFRNKAQKPMDLLPRSPVSVARKTKSHRFRGTENAQEPAERLQKQPGRRVVALLNVFVPQFLQEGFKLGFEPRRNLHPGKNAPDIRAMVPVMKKRDVASVRQRI